MTRRLLAAVSLTAFMTGGFVVVAASASAYEDHLICVGGPNQRDPSRYTGVCVDPRGTVYTP